jgi:hypothetical protein
MGWAFIPEIKKVMEDVVIAARNKNVKITCLYLN